jgi:hypothetical protein
MRGSDVSCGQSVSSECPLRRSCRFAQVIMHGLILVVSGVCYCVTFKRTCENVTWALSEKG